MQKKKDFIAWFIEPIQHHYADFEGRTGRQDFWMFVLTSVIFIMGLSLISSILFYSRHTANTLVSLAQIGIMVPAWAITARRLHDIGKSGWWQLIGLIPLIGAIILIVWLARPSDGHNVYGNKPHNSDHTPQE